MATELFMQCVGNRLAPYSAIDLEALDGIASDEVVKVTITRPRNVKFHRLFFALLKLVYDAQSRYPTMDHLLDAIKIGIGHYDTLELPDGHVVVKPRSISFAKMDERGFRQFYDAVVKFVVTVIIPGADSAELEQQVLEIIGG